jgi:hypothetical protein
LLKFRFGWIIPAAAAIGMSRITAPSRVLPPYCHALMSFTQFFVSSPISAWVTSIFPSEIATPRSAENSKDGPAAIADARKCSYLVFSKLVTTLMFPGL